MRELQSVSERGIAKAPTGIGGFDQVTDGGLPRGRTTLLVGGPGSGKTLFALQFLAHGLEKHKEPGIFVAFEETSDRVVANARSFGWRLAESVRRKTLFFLDAQPDPDLILSGTFDLNGMLAALGAQADAMGARRIVFDALDVVLALLPDPATKRREIYRLHEWLRARQLTGIITAKSGGDETASIFQEPFGFMQFMVDCAVILNHRMVMGVSHRSLHVQKYRGSSYAEGEAPFLIGDRGIELAPTRTAGLVGARVSNERVSSGVKRLDTMLGGGYFRGASVLITGFSGTAKTTLSGTFTEAACRRGERALFVSFDSNCAEVVRNLASVGIRLERHMKSGTLRMVSARAISGSAEAYLGRIKSAATAHGARCLVVDPVSTWANSGPDSSAHSVSERLIDWCKREHITLVCTRLLDEMSSLAEAGSPLQISTLADTWIHLSYAVQAGERNRGLSIVKSRGTAHSNQVRELILSDTGVTLANAYTAGGEVLMGTLRREKERAEEGARAVAEATSKLKRVRLDAEEAEIEVRFKALQVERSAKQVEKALLARATQTRRHDLAHGLAETKELRGADSTVPPRRGRRT